MERFILGSQFYPHFLGKGYQAVISGRLSLKPLAHHHPRAISEATRTISAFFIRAFMLSCFSHVRLCKSMDHNPRDSFVHGILQAKILQWVAMPSSRGSSQPRANPYVLCLLHWQVGSLPLELRRKPTFFI